MYLKKFIDNYISRSPLRMHMPGHKGVLDKRDITEIALCSGERVEDALRCDEELVAKLYRSDNCKLLTGGSTSGILPAIFGLPAGDLLICSNAHISTFNACKISNRKAIIIEMSTVTKPETYSHEKKSTDDCKLSIVDCRFNSSTNLSSESNPSASIPSDCYSWQSALLPKSIISDNFYSTVERTLFSHPNAVGIIVTSPDYFGQTLDIARIRKIIGNKKYLIVDAAHGAHFSLIEGCPQHDFKNADIIIMSAHKTLCAPNQSAISHYNNRCKKDFEKSLALFTTTSPSYVMLEQTINAVMLAKSADISQLCAIADTFPGRILCSKKNYITSPHADKIPTLHTDAVTEVHPNKIATLFSAAHTSEFDPLRFVLDASHFGLSGRELSKELEKNNIIAEFFDEQVVLMIGTLMDKVSDYQKINSVLEKLSNNTQLRYNDF